MIVENKLDVSRLQTALADVPNPSPQLELMLRTGSPQIRVAKNALDSFSKLDFQRLVNVLDHEERFLRDYFYTGLAEAMAARMAEGSKTTSVTRSDIRSAMLAVGMAARVAPEQEISDQTKGLISEICPFCP